MTETTLFAPWENFYVIVGSSGGALTGLQFVVMALIAGVQREGDADLVKAFGTPTVVHFCVVLAVAAILSAPWQSALAPAVILALGGLGGVGYAAAITGRARRQTGYKPVLEDWIWHSILPLFAYAALSMGAVAMERAGSAGLFAIAAASLLLLFIGIHNAWDSVAYIATGQRQAASPSSGR